MYILYIVCLNAFGFQCMASNSWTWWYILLNWHIELLKLQTTLVLPHKYAFALDLLILNLNVRFFCVMPIESHFDIELQLKQWIVMCFMNTWAICQFSKRQNISEMLFKTQCKCVYGHVAWNVCRREREKWEKKTQFDSHSSSWKRRKRK